MKQLVYGIVSSVILVQVVVILIALGGRNVRTTELESNLSNVVEATVTNTCTSKNYTINNYKEFVADFVQNLLVQIESNSTINVDVIKANREKGLLSVRVTMEYKHPNGKEGKITCDKTVILEQTISEDARVFEVNFNVDGKLYKQYKLTYGQQLILPAAPAVNGKVFNQWLNRKTQQEAQDVTALVADKNYTFDAEWK